MGSSRGENGYLKVDLGGSSPEDANRVFDDLQEAIRLLLARHGNLADFEIKGTVTWMDEEGKLHAGRYGKLPTSSPDWSYKWFLAFRRERSVTLDDLSRLVAEIKAEVTDEDVRRHDQAKHRAILAHYLPLGSEQEWKLKRDIGDGWEYDCLTYRGQCWVARRMVKEALIDKLWPIYRPDDLVLPEHEAVVSGFQRGPTLPPEVEVFLALERGETADDTPAALPNDTKPARSKTPARSVGRLAEEPDSFKRQREALLVFARLLKRVPTLDEALDFIKKQSLFTPPWNDNLAARRVRGRGILKYIARTFDPAKCKQRTVNAARLETWAEVNAGKYQGWAKKKFPSGLVGGKKEYVGQDGEIVRQRLHVGPEFLGFFVAVCEFALLVDKNKDQTLPHERAKQTWKALQEKGQVSVPFCDRKWAVCRDELEKHGIVVVTDREFQAGKAMEWDVGRFFPGQGRWKAKKEPSLLDPVSWTEFRLQELATTRREHKTLLRQQSVWNRVSVLLPPVRPPPPTLGARTLW